MKQSPDDGEVHILEKTTFAGEISQPGVNKKYDKNIKGVGLYQPEE